ncbi:MAG: hypothetical protein JRI23_31135 [Deltaproteobacteria bacterium]|jgi:hypothetical protein|nr:hypothetical protein [Deltaproteobacteria bacterium]MBW2536657.1 hypothetical protein [Deltaproteobacteria bacterium]
MVRHGWMMWLVVAVVAAAGPAEAQQGPYSGVDLNSLLETPIRGHDAAVDASGAEILAYGANMSVGQVDGHEAAVTEQDFWLEVTADLSAGVTSLLFEVTAPTRGSSPRRSAGVEPCRRPRVS